MNRCSTRLGTRTLHWLLQFLRVLLAFGCLISPWSHAQQSRPELVEQTGHIASVDALAFTPNGRWLISGGHDFSVRLWDLSNGRQIRILGKHLREVNTVAVCPDSRCVVSGGNDQVLKLWELPSGRLLHTFVGHTAGVECAIFSRDGQQLISGAGDPPNFENRKPDFSIRIWDVRTGQQVRKLEGHNKIVASVDLNQDGSLLATGSFDGTIKIWDFNRGKVLRTIDGFDGEVRAEFSPDGSYLVSASNGRIKLWEVSTGRDAGLLARDARPYKVVFHPTTFQVAYPSEGTVRLVDWKEKRPIEALKSPARMVESIAFSPDGRWLAAGYLEGNIAVWNATDQKKEYDLGGYAARIDSISISPNGLWIASGNRDSSIKMWSAESGCLAYSLKSENSDIDALAFSADGLLLASSGQNYSPSRETPVEIWEIPSGRRVVRFNYSTRRVEFVAFSPDRHWLAASGVEGSIKIWDLHTQREAQTLSPANRVVGFAPDGSWVATGSRDGTLTYWQLPSGRMLRRFPDIGWAYAISPDGRWLASTGWLRDFKVWDIRSVAEQSKYRSDDPSILFSWSWTPGIRRKQHTFRGHSEFVSDVAFSPDSHIVASSGWDGSVKLWDPGSGREIRTLSGHTSGVQRIAFGPDGKDIFSGDGTAPSECGMSVLGRRFLPSLRRDVLTIG